jgi:hypothetical protein
LPIHTGKFRQQHDAVQVSYGGETATVEYNKDAISTKEWRQIRKRAKAEGDEADDEFSVAVLSRLLVKWDVFADEAGKKPVPLTKEALDDLPPAFLNAVVKAITEAMFPGPQTPAATDSGSFS